MIILKVDTICHIQVYIKHSITFFIKYTWNWKLQLIVIRYVLANHAFTIDFIVLLHKSDTATQNNKRSVDNRDSRLLF
jgi:hypothetical protein